MVWRKKHFLSTVKDVRILSPNRFHKETKNIKGGRKWWNLTWFCHHKTRPWKEMGAGLVPVEGSPGWTPPLSRAVTKLVLGRLPDEKGALPNLQPAEQCRGWGFQESPPLTFRCSNGKEVKAPWPGFRWTQWNAEHGGDFKGKLDVPWSTISNLPYGGG